MQNIKFQKIHSDSQFLIDLRSRVNKYFSSEGINKYATNLAIFKAVVLVILYIIANLSLFTVNSFAQLILANMIIGVCSIFVALNIAHDAAHNAFTKSKKINNLLVYTFDLLGASGYIWKHKHIYAHHPHVNIPELDTDIKQSKLVRISPTAKWFSNHRYQHFYMPFLYLFYTLFWLLIRDFRDFFEVDKDGDRVMKHKKKDYIILFLVKLIFVGRMLILPYLLLPFTFGQILISFMCFHFIASFTVALPLVSAHVGENAKFPEPNKNGVMPSSWVRHQLVTTTDFAVDSALITHIFGGFNHHVAHHLFPDVCYVHYPQVTQILKETCKEHDMPYVDNPTMTKAVWSHLRFLKQQGMEGKRAEYIDM